MSLIRALITTTPVLGTVGLAQAQARLKNDGQMRASFGPGASLSSGNRQSSNLSMNGEQRLTLVPKLKNRGEFRANLDAGLSVAMSKAMNLNVGFALTHNSELGAGRKATDTLLTTGESVKFD